MKTAVRIVVVLQRLFAIAPEILRVPTRRCYRRYVSALCRARACLVLPISNRYRSCHRPKYPEVDREPGSIRSNREQDSPVRWDHLARSCSREKSCVVSCACAGDAGSVKPPTIFKNCAEGRESNSIKGNVFIDRRQEWAYSDYRGLDPPSSSFPCRRRSALRSNPEKADPRKCRSCLCNRRADAHW